MGKELIKIGFISKAHGIKGEVFLKIFDKEDSYLTKKTELFIKEQAYSIEQLRRANEGLIIKLSGVSTRNDSELFRGAEVSVAADIFKETSDGKRYLNQLKGFEVYLDGELKGTVCGFSETAAHDLLRVELPSGGEVEIPYVEVFIAEVKEAEKLIAVNCPEELFDEDFLSGSKK
ncbi:MAG: ribosome maturation factor RimM [Bdellovibrionales bacterium]